MRMTVELANGTKVSESYPASVNPADTGYRFRALALATARKDMTTVKWSTIEVDGDEA